VHRQNLKVNNERERPIKKAGFNSLNLVA